MKKIQKFKTELITSFILLLNSPDILALCETNLKGSIDSGHFFVRGYLPLIQKNSITNMHGLAVYVKEGLRFARDLSLGNFQILTFVFNLLYFTHCPTYCSSVDLFICLCARFLILFNLK